jgi:hypothetical protein
VGRPEDVEDDGGDDRQPVDRQVGAARREDERGTADGDGPHRGDGGEHALAAHAVGIGAEHRRRDGRGQHPRQRDPADG